MAEEIGAFCAGLAIGLLVGVLLASGCVADRTCADASARMVDGRCMPLQQATKAEALQRELAALKGRRR